MRASGFMARVMATSNLLAMRVLWDAALFTLSLPIIGLMLSLQFNLEVKMRGGHEKATLNSATLLISLMALDVTD